jgi:pimeloyl-ACP methyl ester carboxylesterase/aryl carrier-like protein
VQAAVADMERQGAHIVVTRTDVSDAAQLDKVLAIEGLPQLRGVVHCAGILDDGAITGQTRERFARVFAPKAQGAWNLHLLTRRMPLDFFVLYSSVTSIFGSPGQANYAAANAYLDALAHVRRREGLPAISINWGPWADVGMAARLERRMSYVNLYGVSSIQPAEGVAAFGEIVARNPAQVTFLQLDIAALVESMPVVLDSPFYSALTAGYAATAAAETSEIFAQLLAAAQGDRSDIALAYLRTALAQIVGAPEDLFTPESNLLELGLDSLMAMDLINGIKRDLRVTLYPREFYQRPFTGQLAEYLAQEFEIANRATADSPAPIEPGIEVAWPTVAIAPAVVTHRNPPAVFLLSSPRSGSTLLRVMLAGHPQLFCPPELHLLPFADMKHRSAMLGSSWMDEGFQRALMELTGGSVEQSRSTIAAMEERGASTQDAYLLLQDLAQGKLLVDKSPTYAGSPEALARAEALFEKPKYIHLVRHPYAVIESFARMRMHRLIGMDHADPWRLAEQIWSASNRNLDAFFEGVDPARRHKIRYEDLVSEPERCMRALCEFLEIPWDAALLSPYEGPRMTDGLHAQSLGVGDPGFRNHTQIDASLSDVWRKVRLPAPLGELARTTARELGYELPKTAAASRSVSSPSFGELPRESFADVGSLRLCVCEWGPQDGVPILCLHGILDQAAVWGPVASRLASQGYRVIAPDLRGHGRSQHAPTPNSYQLLDVLSDLDGLTTQLFDEPFTLVGHSMGAALAAVFAAVRSPKVASLVLVEPGVVLDAPERDPADLLAVQLDYLASPPVHPVFADLEVAAERLRQVTPALSREFAMHLAGRATEPYGKGFRWRWDPPLRTRSSLDMGMDQFRRLLGRISAPTVLVRGVKSDFLSPENAKLLLKAIAGSREATADGGHYLPVETPEALAEWIADAAAAEALRRTAVAGIGLG